MKKLTFSLFLFVICLGFAAPAHATVVTFDDLGGVCNNTNGNVPNGYGGINWNGVWTCYTFSQPPYTPHSDPGRVYDFASEGQFSFVTPGQIFNGAWFSGLTSTTVQFLLYTNLGDLVPVATSSILATSSTPTFLSSGYSGPVTKIGVLTNAPDFFVMDDVTYNATTAPIPEPATLFLLGTGLVGLTRARSRKQK